MLRYEFIDEYCLMQKFWADPPWGEGGRRYRLGAKPIPPDDWLTEDPDVSANKQKQLKQRPEDVVFQSEVVDTSSWNLPWSPATNHDQWIVNLSSPIAEDVCVLDLANNLRLVAGCVAAPSYWRLHDKKDKPLWQIHDSVDGLNPILGQRIEHFLMHLPEEQAFVRRNWFVHDRAEYWPTALDEFVTPPECWWFRSERQVIYRPQADWLLFTICVSFAPVGELAEHPTACMGLNRALTLMSDEEISYFGGVEKHRRIHEYVRLIEENKIAN